MACTWAIAAESSTRGISGTPGVNESQSVPILPSTSPKSPENHSKILQCFFDSYSLARAHLSRSDPARAQFQAGLVDGWRVTVCATLPAAIKLFLASRVPFMLFQAIDRHLTRLSASFATASGKWFFKKHGEAPRVPEIRPPSEILRLLLSAWTPGNPVDLEMKCILYESTRARTATMDSVQPNPLLVPHAMLNCTGCHPLISIVISGRI